MVDNVIYTPEISNNWSRGWYEASRYRPWLVKRLVDSFTTSQVQTKLWMINELINVGHKPKNCVLLGGWFGHIATNLLIDGMGAEFVMNYEIDEDVKWASFKFNRHYKDNDKFRCQRKNVLTEKTGGSKGFHLNDKLINFDTIINTSCEHMFPMKQWKKRNEESLKNRVGFVENPLIILQSTSDERFEDHINTVQSADELAEQGDLMDVLFSGSKILDNGLERFMVIGR